MQTCKIKKYFSIFPKAFFSETSEPKTKLNGC